MSKQAPQHQIPVYFLYGEAPRRISGPMLHVETIEARSARHHWKIEPHLHQVLHQLILVVRGRGISQAESARTQFRPPALILMPAGSVHGFEFEPGTTGYVASISTELQRDLLLREPQIGVLFAAPATLEFTTKALRATDLAQSFRMLAREFGRSATGHNLALHGWLEVLLANAQRLAQQRPNAADPVVSQRLRLVARFSSLIESRFRSSGSLATYTAALNVSESRLRNACLAVAGQPPIQLIHARILLEAKRQLLYTDNPVRAIAYALGFQDPAYFARFFSRLTRLSPRAFRARGPERAAVLR
jgi:AraC family transcriptional activator of pobA